MLVVEFVVLVTPNVGHAINRLLSVFSRVGCTWSSGFIGGSPAGGPWIF